MFNLLSPRFDVYDLKYIDKSLNFYLNFKEILLKILLYIYILSHIIDNNIILIILEDILIIFTHHTMTQIWFT